MCSVCVFCVCVLCVCSVCVFCVCVLCVCSVCVFCVCVLCVCSVCHRKKFRVPDIGKYPRNRLIPPHIPNIGFVEQKQPWVFAAEFYDSMLVKRVSTGGN